MISNNLFFLVIKVKMKLDAHKLITPPMVEGLKGKEVKLVETPKYGGVMIEEGSINRPKVGLQHGSIDAPRLMRSKMTATNISGRRGVMPCKGEYRSSYILRRDATDLYENMYPKQGTGRHQERGLAYEEWAPLNNKLMPLYSLYNPALPSKIPNLPR